MWAYIAIIMVACTILTVIVPPKYSDNNPRVTSVGFWIATGLITIHAIAWLLGAKQSEYFGWALLVWMILAVVLGAFWPLPFIRRISNGS